MTDEEFVAQLRVSLHSAVAAADPPADLLEAVVQEHQDTRLGRSARHWSGVIPSRGRLRLSGLGSTVAVLATVAVVVGALLLVHSNNQPTTSVVTTPTGSGLTRILAVLRRPQDQADRRAAAMSQRVFGHLRLSRSDVPVESAVRVATVTPWGAKVVFVPVRPRSDPSEEQLAISGAGGAGCCSTPAEIAAGHDWLTSGSRTANYVVLVVPDGVARVKVALRHPQTAAVHGNVAAFKTPEPIENLNTYRMIWYAPDGKIVKRTSPAQARQPQLSHAQLVHRAETQPVQIIPQIADHFALFQNDQGGSFGHSQNRFQISHPTIASLPDGVLVTTGGPGNPNDARQARELVTQSGIRLWILAGTSVCTLTGLQGEGGSCSGNGRAHKTGQVITQPTPHGDPMLIGIVPNTNKTIEMRTSSGATRYVSVHDGVFVTSATGIASYRIRATNGTATWVQQR
jgi:hypothetical protein